MAHNFYQHSGGEDKCFAAETELLRQHGHEVVTYTVHNDAIRNMSGVSAALMAVWNRSCYRELSTLIRAETPDIIHFHNTFPMISPAAIWAGKRRDTPVVCTLHNYRLVCPAAALVRNGRVCEDCIGHTVPWQAVVHRCYRDSRLASAAVASTLVAHRLARTWSDKVDAFIALTEFARQKFIEGGLPAEKIVLKPNFVDREPFTDPNPAGAGRGYALFVGRLSSEKGIDPLLAAWKKLTDNITLRVVGTGPLSSQVEAAASQSDSIEFLGPKQPEEVLELMTGAQFVVVPSICYETFGLTIVEAYSMNTPVIASRLGAMTEVVQEGQTGLCFNPGDPDDLAAKVAWAANHPAEMRAMGENARSVFVNNYGAERNYQQLMAVYESVH